MLGFRSIEGMSIWGLGGFSSVLAFAVMASLGSFDSILMDWSHHEPTPHADELDEILRQSILTSVVYVVLAAIQFLCCAV